MLHLKIVLFVLFLSSCMFSQELGVNQTLSTTWEEVEQLTIPAGAGRDIVRTADGEIVRTKKFYIVTVSIEYQQYLIEEEYRNMPGYGKLIAFNFAIDKRRNTL